MGPHGLFALLQGTLRGKLSRRKNGDYAINELQLEKFFSLYEYLLDKISELNSIFGASSAWLSRVSIIPKEEDAMISVVLPLFLLPEEEIPGFIEKLRDCSAFQIDPRDNDTVEIACFVPNIFFRL